MSDVQGIIDRDKQTWDKSIHNNFIDACADGSIQKKQFLTWLEQDYKFVDVFVRLVAMTIALAPREDLDSLLAVIAALRAEIIWFREQAEKDNCNLDTVKILPATARYISSMEGWLGLPYANLITALWAIEYSYFKTWRECKEVAPEYREMKERWSSDAFGESVSKLEGHANKSLKDADKATYDVTVRICHDVAALEIDFWDMAMAA